MLDSACDERAGRILQSGLRVALCGQPNVGKSSLLNALLGEERAIVTPIPGTTRDMVTGELLLSGSVIHLTDTAGLHATDDPVEQIGVARARRAMEEADLVLAVLDASRPLTSDDHALLDSLTGRTCAIVLNKADLPAILHPADMQPLLPAAPVFPCAANQPASLTPLKAFLADQAAVSDRLALPQPRPMEAARRAASHLRQAAGTARTLTVDMASLDLQAAQLALAEITGDEVEERLLDRVFGLFCVGKWAPAHHTKSDSRHCRSRFFRSCSSTKTEHYPPHPPDFPPPTGATPPFSVDNLWILWISPFRCSPFFVDKFYAPPVDFTITNSPHPTNPPVQTAKACMIRLLLCG